MLIDFFFALRTAKVPVTIREFLLLLEALEKQVIAPSLDAFYYLARLTLVKDEAHFDKFDRAFGAYFKGIEAVFDDKAAIPLDWLVKRLERELTPEQKAALQKFGYDKLMDRLRQLLQEQKERHEGGNKWIGTGGTSPFGHGGTNPEGIRIGADPLAQLRAVAEFFRRTEPHSPVAYLADKAAHWGEQPLHVWLRALVKDETAVARIEEMLGVGEKPAT